MQKWQMEVPWPKESSYVLRCTEEQFGVSKGKSAPMVTLEYEVVGIELNGKLEESIEINGEQYLITGVPIKARHVLKSLDDSGNEDTEKSAKCVERYEDLLDKFEIPHPSAIDVENPLMGFKGKVVYALLTDNEQEQRRAPTKEQLSKGIKQGDVLINPKTKKPLKIHYPQISDIFGIAPVDMSNRPY